MGLLRAEPRTVWKLVWKYHFNIGHLNKTRLIIQDLYTLYHEYGPNYSFVMEKIAVDTLTQVATQFKAQQFKSI